MGTLVCILRALLRAEEGQDLVEYALLIVLLALAVVVGVATAGRFVGSWYDTIHSTLAAL